jgi:triosephosphate isomerase
MGIDKPIILINLKRLTGITAFNLVSKLELISEDTFSNYDILLGVQPIDIEALSTFERFKLVVQDTFSDEMNNLDCYFSSNKINCSKVFGILLNHPEKKTELDIIINNINKSRALGLKVLLCTTNLEEAVLLNQYMPEFIGIENQSLIGKPISILNHCPEIVREAKHKVKNRILFGAGIKSKMDLDHVLKEGGSGVLISSIILNSNDPKTALETFLNSN